MFKLYYREEKNYDKGLLLELDLPFVEVVLSREDYEAKFPGLESSPQVFKNNSFFGSTTTLDEYLEKYRYVYSEGSDV